MYKFIDTIEASEGLLLPSEALKINGEYIENLISGYRTLNVVGREALSPDVESYTTGIRDGSKLKRKRYPERIIIVTYQIKTATNGDYRAAYNKLAAILDVEDAELIFNDEQDKYFIGTPCIIGEVTPGSNAVVGKFEILCTDPFKYSVVEYEATPNVNNTSVLIDYKGTYKAYPTLEAQFYNEQNVSDDGVTVGTLTGNGDCGFVAFFTDKEKIIQLGNPDEVDGSNAYAKSQTLLNQLFHKSTSYGSATQALLSHNSGNVLPGGVQQTGSFKMDIASYAVATSETSATVLEAWSDAGEPKFNYVVSLKASSRTTNSVKIDATITTALKYDGSYFGRGYGLNASLYIGGSWHDVTLKTTSEYWEGRSGHTKNLSFTVSGLSATTSAITGIKFKTTRSDNTGGTAGILAEKNCSNLPIIQYQSAQAETYYLTANSYGSSSGNWHGPTITKVLPADSANVTGAKDFTATSGIRMGIGNGNGDTKQMGALQIQITDASNNHIAGMRIYKNTVGTAGTCNYFINGVKVLESGFSLEYNNEVFGAASNGGTCTISKVGNEITFTVGKYKQVFVDDAISEMLAAKITYGIEQYSTNTALSYAGFQWIKFVKNNCDTYKDIPNKFSANDIVRANCKNGTIYLNDVLAPELGALGNDWETFYLRPGINEIGFAYSSWVPSNVAPTIKVKFREVFL